MNESKLLMLILANLIRLLIIVEKKPGVHRTNANILDAQTLI